MAIRVFKDVEAGALTHAVFDFDNGIVDTESVFAVFDCLLLNEALEQAGQAPDLVPSQVRLLAGKSGGEKLLYIAEQRGFDASGQLAAFHAQRSALRKSLFQDRPAVLAPGFKSILRVVDKDHRALATNKKSVKLLPDMAAMGLTDLFDVVITTDHFSKKPAPDIIYEALRQLGAEAGVSGYWGDNVSDIEASVAAGVFAFGIILEGFDDQDQRIAAMQKAGAHAVMDSYEDALVFFDPALRVVKRP